MMSSRKQWRRLRGTFLAVLALGGLAIPGAAFAVDILPYMLNTSGFTMQDTRSGYGQMQRTHHDPARRFFWYGKNPYESHRWELYYYDDTRVWLYRDTTLPANEGPGTAYDVSPWDAMWMPRQWNQGEEKSFNANIYYFNHLQNPCPYSSTVGRWPQGRHKLRFVGRINVGGALGEQDVIVVDRYHDLTSNIWNPKTAERFWYAKGFGWVRWEYWPDSARNNDGSSQSTDGRLDRTEDSKWNSSAAADLLSTSPQKRIMMNQKTNANPGITNVACR
jgi:hypothetical protein